MQERLDPQRAAVLFGKMRAVVRGDPSACKELRDLEQNEIVRHVAGFKKACDNRNEYRAWKDVETGLPSFHHAEFLEKCGRELTKEVTGKQTPVQQGFCFDKAVRAVTVNEFTPAVLKAFGDHLEQVKKTMHPDLFETKPEIVPFPLFRSLYSYAHKHFHEGKKKGDEALTFEADRVCSLLEAMPPMEVKILHASHTSKSGTIAEFGAVSVRFESGHNLSRVSLVLNQS